MASAGLFRGRRPTGRYWFLLGICSFVLLMMWMPYLVSLGGDAPSTAALNDESRRVIEVVVMLILNTGDPACVAKPNGPITGR